MFCAQYWLIFWDIEWASFIRDGRARDRCILCLILADDAKISSRRLIRKRDIQYLHILYLILIDGVSYGFTDLFFNGNGGDWRVLCQLLTDSVKLGIFEFVP